MADINFILDSSTSVTSVNYEKMKRLTVQISQAFNVGKRLTHYAMLHYGYWVDIDFTFAESNYWVKANLEEKILASEYLYGNINLKTLRLTLSLYHFLWASSNHWGRSAFQEIWTNVTLLCDIT